MYCGYFQYSNPFAQVSEEIKETCVEENCLFPTVYLEDTAVIALPAAIGNKWILVEYSEKLIDNVQETYEGDGRRGMQIIRVTFRHHGNARLLFKYRKTGGEVLSRLVQIPVI